MVDRALGRADRAFTLMELLVVVAIIALLAALILPVLLQSRKHAQMGACINNLSQLGKAAMLYRDDYDGSYATHLTQLLPYVKTLVLFECPLDPTGGIIGASTRQLGSPVSYVYLSESEEFRRLLAEADPSHGIFACVLHGRPLRGWGLPPQRGAFNPIATYTGLVLRVCTDGAVKRAQVAPRCYRLPNGARLAGRSVWELLTDAPCPPVFCSVPEGATPIPCENH